MWSFLRGLSPRVVLCATWLIAVLYAFPGYMNFDIADQLIQLRQHDINDFHPPILVGYWRIFEVFIAGPFSLLMLQSILFLWGIHSVLRLRLAERPAAWIAGAVILFPPVLTPMAMVWKDAQMAAFLIAGIALALRPARRSRILGMVLLALAAGVRYNGGAALPFLVFLAVSGWASRRLVVRVGLVAALLATVFVATSLVNRALTDHRRYNWYRTTAIFDIVGIGCYAPPLSDAELTALLEGVTLREHVNLQKRFCEEYPPGKRSWYTYAGLFEWHPQKEERIARLHVWTKMVERFPAAYLRSRLQFAADHLGLIPAAWIWEPVGQDFAANEEQLHALSYNTTHSPLQTALGDAFRWLALHTPLYHAWIYLLLAVVLAAWAAWKRDLLVGCLVGSGILYEISILLLANAPDFRYSHWMVTCTCLGAVLAITAWRAGRTPAVSPVADGTSAVSSSADGAPAVSPSTAATPAAPPGADGET